MTLIAIRMGYTNLWTIVDIDKIIYKVLSYSIPNLVTT